MESHSASTHEPRPRTKPSEPFRALGNDVSVAVRSRQSDCRLVDRRALQCQMRRRQWLHDHLVDVATATMEGYQGSTIGRQEGNDLHSWR